MPGNSNLIGVDHSFDLYLAECAIETSEIEVSTRTRAQCNLEAKCEALESNASYQKAFELTVRNIEREELLSDSVWPKGVFIKNHFKPRVY